MNLSSAFEKMKTKQYQLTAKQRLIVVAAIGIMAILITAYMTTSEVAVEHTLPNNNPQQSVIYPSNSAKLMGNQMAQVNQVEQTMRDPFARVPEAKEQKNVIDRGLPFIQNNVRSNIPTTVPKKIVTSIPNENLRLTGIVGNAERRLAVIMSANKSQSYSLNEVIGIYKIVAINEDSVILKNATGRLVLRLE